MEKKVYMFRIGAVGGLSLAIHLGLWLLLANIHPLTFVSGASFEKVKAYVQVKAIGAVHLSKQQHILKRSQPDNIIASDIVQREPVKPRTRPHNSDHHEAKNPGVEEPSIKGSSSDQSPELAAVENRGLSSGEANSFKRRGARLDLSSIVTPEFTDEALTVGLEGVFEVEIWVNELGEVEQAKLRQPIGFGMESNLLEAAQFLRFTPAKDRNGVAIADHLIIPYSLKRVD